MSAEVYYFTGTGNSFVVARNIAQNINGKLVSIASTEDENNLLINAKTMFPPRKKDGIKHIYFKILQ